MGIFILAMGLVAQANLAYYNHEETTGEKLWEEWTPTYEYGVDQVGN